MTKLYSKCFALQISNNNPSMLSFLEKRSVEIKKVATVLSLFLNLEEGENDENDLSNIEILLIFDAAIVVE